VNVLVDRIAWGGSQAVPARAPSVGEPGCRRDPSTDRRHATHADAAMRRVASPTRIPVQQPPLGAHLPGRAYGDGELSSWAALEVCGVSEYRDAWASSHRASRHGRSCATSQDSCCERKHDLLVMRTELRELHNLTLITTISLRRCLGHELLHLPHCDLRTTTLRRAGGRELPAVTIYAG